LEGIQKIEKKTLIHPQNEEKLVEEVQKYKNLNFDSIFLTNESSRDKEKSI